MRGVVLAAAVIMAAASGPHASQSADAAGRASRRPSRAHAQAYDEDARVKLRQLSFELTGLPATP